LIHAAPRTELRELHALREMLMAKYTREFALRATENADGCVPSRVTDRLKAQVQQRGFVDSYIAEGECLSRRTRGDEAPREREQREACALGVGCGR
jgi:hypothetical protein